MTKVVESGGCVGKKTIASHTMTGSSALSVPHLDRKEFMKKIKKLPVIECWAIKSDVIGWIITDDKEVSDLWIAWGRKPILGTFIPHKEGKH